MMLLAALLAILFLKGATLASATFVNHGYLLLNQAVAHWHEQQAPASLRRAEASLDRARGLTAAEYGLHYAQALQHLDEGGAAPVTAHQATIEHVVFTLGERAQRLQQDHDALVWYQTAAAMNPSWWQPWYRIGVIYKQQESWPEAAQALTRSVELAPEQRDPWLQLAQVYSLQGEPAAALHALESGLAAKEGETGRSDLLYLVGRIKQQEDQVRDLEGALAAYQEALKVNDFTASDARVPVDIYQQQGTIFTWQQRWSEAIAAFNEALALHPESYWIRLGLATALLQAGRPGDAELVIQEALALQPDRGEGYRLLGKIHAAQGDLAEARSAYERALILNPQDDEARSLLGALTQERQEE